MDSRLVPALVLLLSAAPLAAQTLDPASGEALGATLRMLRDPALREAAIAAGPQAVGVDAQVQGLAGASPELTQEFYELVARMNETLHRAQSDPAGFAALLSPGTLDRLRALSVKMSDRPR